MKISEFFETHGWTQGAFARSKKKRPVLLKSPRAICFCLVGALDVCYPKMMEKDRVKRLLYERFPDGIVEWNDAKGRTKAEVIALAKELDI